MVKILLYLIFFLVQIMQLLAQKENVIPLSMECEIVKIDSVGNYYVIYAKHFSEKYKIVSKKDSTVCQNIKDGQYYKLTLYPHKISPNVTYQIFPDGTAIIPHQWGYDLYSSLEIRGLCYDIKFAVDIFKIKEQSELKFKNKREMERYFHKLKKERKKTRISTYYENNPLSEWDYDDK